MLKALTIQDLAVIRHLDVEFQSGLTILTGETGAGKSILIEALGLALGDRADSSMVRASAKRATVSATFDVDANEALKGLLHANDLEDGSHCILRRVMGADGRTRAFCNAAPVPVQLLKQIGNLLVDIHGQHAHHSLLRRQIQRELLDEYGGYPTHISAIADAYRQWHDCKRELEKISKGTDDVPSRIDLLSFQADEIDALQLSKESLATLEAEHRRIGHGARLIAACESAATLAFDDEASAVSQTVKAAHLLRDLSSIEPAMTGIVELLEQAVINLEEAEHDFTQLRSGIETNPQRLEQIDRQLQLIQDIARKHRCEPQEIPNRLSVIRAELLELSNREEQIEQANLGLVTALEKYAKESAELHKNRVRAAKKMQREITERLRELGIPHAEFIVQIEKNTLQPNAHGDDEIEFLVTANPDQPVKPLRKVASGGELSRISLAIQVATTGNSGIPVMVFDEVDTGVGGATAEVVSRYLKELSDRQQILCITHLPQVASSGLQHYFIGKIVAGGITETTIRDLDADERVEEIARMLGGQKVTKKAREHARELLSQ